MIRLVCSKETFFRVVGYTGSWHIVTTTATPATVSAIFALNNDYEKTVNKEIVWDIGKPWPGTDFDNFLPQENTGLFSGILTFKAS
jgi:hypothetical protein